MRFRAPATSTLRRLLASGTITLVTATGLVLTGPNSPANADHQGVEPGRRIVQHTVRPGDTPSGLAVRYHAWTAELIKHNHLGGAGALRVGDRIEIPVVISATKADKRTKASKNSTPRGKAKKGKAKKKARTFRYGQLVPPSVNRQKARRVIASTARKRGVDPQLALAIAWQESGWQMDQVSSARALGAMQVLPSTVEWMELYVDRGLNPYRLSGNATTGVELLRVLGKSTSNRRRQVAAYYQGLGAVREHGIYDVSKPYVRNVLAIKRRLERGQAPG